MSGERDEHNRHPAHNRKNVRQGTVRFHSYPFFCTQRERRQLRIVVVWVQLDLREAGTSIWCAMTKTAGEDLWGRTWFTAGTISALARSISRSGTPKLETPILFVAPVLRNPSNLRHTPGISPCAELGV